MARAKANARKPSAPKRSKAQAKTRAKAKATAAPRFQNGANEVTELLAGKDHSASCEAVQRQLKRQRTDAQVDRIMRRKVLTVFSSDVVEGATDQDGKSLRQVIADKIRENMTSMKKLTQDWFNEVFEAFNLDQQPASKLPEPDDDGGDEVGDRLLRAFSAVTDPKPGGKGYLEVESFFDDVESMNYKEWYVALNAISEGVKVPRDQSIVMRAAAIRCMARLSAKDSFPVIWVTMRKNLEDAMTSSFKCFVARGLNAGNFLRKYKQALGLFVGQDAADHLVKAATENTEPNAEIFESSAMDCALARVAFSKHARELTYKQFVDDICKGIKDLTFHDFAEEEVQAFKKIMRGNVARLDAAGWTNQPLRAAKFKFMDAEVEVSTSSLHDQWTLRLSAALKETAANCGILSLLPWEALLWLPGELSHVNSSAEIPENLLCDFANVRDAVRSKFQGKELTIMEMRRAIANDSKALCGLDASFIIEVAYLSGPVETMLAHKAHDMVLKALPSESSPAVTWRTALAGIKEVSKSPVCLAGGTGLSGELEGMLSLVQKLSEGQGPDPERVKHMSSFYRSVLHRLSFFCQWKEGGRANAVRFGRQALVLATDDVKKDATTNESTPLVKTKLLRQFEWMLSLDERLWLDGVVFNARKSISFFKGGKKAILNEPVEAPAAEPLPANSSSSSPSTALAVAPKASPASPAAAPANRKQAKLKECLAVKDPADPTGLLKLFSAKKA